VNNENRFYSFYDRSSAGFVALTDLNEPKSSGGGGGSSYPQSPFGKSGEAIPFTSPEDLMKNLPKVMSNMLSAADCIVDAGG